MHPLVVTRPARAAREGRASVYDLTDFALRDMTTCGAALRKLGTAATTLPEVALAIVRHLYENLRIGPDGGRACALARYFQTRAYADLDEALQRFARQRLGEFPPRQGMKCLVLLATAGDLPAWNSPKTSVDHQA